MSSMKEVFSYPSGLCEQLDTESRRRRWFWALFLSPFVAGSIWAFASGTPWLGLIGIVFTGAIWVIAEEMLARFVKETKSLAGEAIEVEDQIVREVNRLGKAIAEIDLARPFTVGYPSFVFGNAIYHVRQATDVSVAELRFSSRIENAERLVKDILHHDDFPPGSKESLAN